MIYSVKMGGGYFILVARGDIEGNPLDESIRKWRFIVQWLSENKECLDDGGIDTCALCMSFKCHECPVGVLTKKSCCQGSPYRQYATAIDDAAEALEAARAELAFLEGLKEKQC